MPFTSKNESLVYPCFYQLFILCKGDKYEILSLSAIERNFRHILYF